MKYWTGILWDVVDERDYDAEAILGSPLSDLPSKIDLSGIADVKNQWSKGWCSAFASTLAHEILNNMDLKRKVELDAPYLFDTYQIPTGASYERWDYASNAIKQIIAHWSKAMWNDTIYETNWFARVYDKRPDALKHYLASKTPVLVWMNVMTTNNIATGSTSSQAIWDYNTGQWKYNPTGWGHFFVVVWYDDETELFKCQNSWGENYGDNGFVYIPYGKMTKYMYNSTYVIYDKTNMTMICEDVSSEAWYSDAVKYCLDNGYLTTDAKNRFRPSECTPEVSKTINRATVAQILYNLHKLDKI